MSTEITYFCDSCMEEITNRERMFHANIYRNNRAKFKHFHLCEKCADNMLFKIFPHLSLDLNDFEIDECEEQE